jgi:hypothetical protein
MTRMQVITATIVVALAVLPIRARGQEKSMARELGTAVGATSPIELARDPFIVHIVMQGDSRARIEAAMASSSKTKLVLRIGGIEYDKTPDVCYEVYLDLPSGVKPNYKNPYFVANLVFFRLGAGTRRHAYDTTFEITRVVRALKSFKSWNDGDASVTFVVLRPVGHKGGQQLAIPGVRLRFRDMKILAVEPEP